MNRANSQIQHVVRLDVKKSTYSREQNLNQSESAIRRRFVPDSFQQLTTTDFARPWPGSFVHKGTFRFRFTPEVPMCRLSHAAAPPCFRLQAAETLFPSR